MILQLKLVVMSTKSLLLQQSGLSTLSSLRPSICQPPILSFLSDLANSYKMHRKTASFEVLLHLPPEFFSFWEVRSADSFRSSVANISELRPAHPQI
jgi:hypothetical protein